MQSNSYNHDLVLMCIQIMMNIDEYRNMYWPKGAILCEFNGPYMIPNSVRWVLCSDTRCFTTNMTVFDLWLYDFQHAALTIGKEGKCLFWSIKFNYGNNECNMKNHCHLWKLSWNILNYQQTETGVVCHLNKYMYSSFLTMVTIIMSQN